MAPEDIPSLTLGVLREIRDEIKRTNKWIEQTNERIDLTNGRLDLTNERLEKLERRQTETEVRLSTELVAVAGAVRELGDLLRADRAMRSQVDEHDKRISALEKKVG